MCYKNFRDKPEIKKIQNEVKSALEYEKANIPTYYDFIIAEKKQLNNNIWALTIEEDDENYRIDNSLEEAECFWNKDEQKGYAEVLSINYDKSIITIRNANIEPPRRGENIRLYPMDFLQNLIDLWSNYAYVKKFYKELNINDNFRFEEFEINPQKFKCLREYQRKAFDLPTWKKSFLWGPPGTGKTFLLGRLLAAYYSKFPEHKILLIAPTNIAIDNLLISLDDSLEFLNIPKTSIRKKCKRVGNRFSIEKYEDKKHLIPVANKDLLDEYAKLKEVEPDKDDIKNYAIWQNKIRNYRKKLKKNIELILLTSNVIAITTFFALFNYEILESINFDLIVFDEISQISLAQTLALASLGKRKIYTGDFKQLSPIYRSKNENVKKWLGKTIFNFVKKNEDYFFILNEQSRMSKKICDLVSNIFYDGILKVAIDKISNKEWLEERKLRNENVSLNNEVLIVETEDEGTWSDKYKGYIRYNSAKKITEIVRQLIGEIDRKDILILVPYHSQRRLIKRMLNREKLKKIDVTTIHKAQGSERHTIIFDPVYGESKFFTTDPKIADQLVNVAISRAKARLIIFLNDIDLKAETLRRIYYYHHFHIKNILNELAFRDISEFFKDNKLIKNIKNEQVKIGDKKFIIIGKENENLILLDTYSSLIKKYKIPILLKNIN